MSSSILSPASSRQSLRAVSIFFSFSSIITTLETTSSGDVWCEVCCFFVKEYYLFILCYLLLFYQLSQREQENLPSIVQSIKYFIFSVLYAIDTASTLEISFIHCTAESSRLFFGSIILGKLGTDSSLVREEQAKRKEREKRKKRLDRTRKRNENRYVPPPRQLVINQCQCGRGGIMTAASPFSIQC